MRMTSLRRLALPLTAALLLGACSGKDQPATPGGNSPEAAVQASIDLLKKGDFDGLWKHALPPTDYANMVADWDQQRAHAEPVSAEDRARFDEAMQKLTGPDAETKLYAELEPQLIAMEQQYKDQLPTLITVGQAVLKSGVAQSDSLEQQQKDQANAVIDVIGPWASQTNWFDHDKARQAIGVATSTARKLDLKDPDQVRSLAFDAAMGKLSTGYVGVKQILDIYGLSVDETLDSVKLTPVSSADGHAVVKVDYTLLGKPLSTETKLVQQDGRWYSEDMLENARKSHEKLQEQQAAQPDEATPAEAGSAAADH